MHLEGALALLELVVLAGMSALVALNAPSSNMTYNVLFDVPDSVTVHSSKLSDALPGSNGAISQAWTATNGDSLVDVAASSETNMDVGPVITGLTSISKAAKFKGEMNATDDDVFIVHNDYVVKLMITYCNTVLCPWLSPVKKPFL